MLAHNNCPDSQSASHSWNWGDTTYSSNEMNETKRNDSNRLLDLEEGGRGYICTLYKKITLCHSAVTHSCHLTPCDPTNALQRTKKKNNFKRDTATVVEWVFEGRMGKVEVGVLESVFFKPSQKKKNIEEKTGCSYIMY